MKRVRLAVVLLAVFLQAVALMTRMPGALSSSRPGGEQVGAEREIEFNRDIRPLLSDKCFYCHGPDDKNRKAGLRLDTFEGATKDRGGYRAIAPGKPDESELLRRVTSHEAAEVMPPPAARKDAITPAEAALLRRWIEQGAKYQGHWAFQPLSTVGPPEVKRSEWVRNEIDRFVLARLEREGIEPSPQADGRTLIRRLSLDLLGLLPTPAEVESFATAFDRAGTRRQEELYRQLVERLLASPHYGERWGRHWLDQARYADSNGYTIDGERVMWPYRDWVIEALNRDLPFDRFTIEQLAGDLLPAPADARAAKAQLVATGFHRNTVINEEGGVDPEQARVEQVMDRVSTTGAVWLGLTVGCAQCHTHKFDPITHREYYQMFAFFNSAVDYNNLGPTVFVEKGEMFGRPKPPTPAAATTELSREEWERTEIARLEKSAAVSSGAREVKWLPFKVIRYDTEAFGRIRQLADGSFMVSSNGSVHDAYRLLGTIDQPGLPAARLRVYPDESLPGRGPGLGEDGSFTLSEFYIESEGGGHRFAEAFASEEDPAWPAWAATDNDRRTGWSLKPGASGAEPREAIFVFGPQKKFLSRQVQFVLRHDALENRGVGRFRIEIASEVPRDEKGAALLAALKTPAASRTAEQSSMIAAAFATAKAVRARQTSGAVMAMIMRDVAEPRPSYIFARGDFTRPDKEAGLLRPGVFRAVAPALPGDSRQLTRLDLARWLVDAANPLTPRVTVNRIWMRYFGRGIVETEEDFGTQGAYPAHPELLDWLSGEFIRRGWSLKSMHRLIVTSMTYRQSSKSRADLVDKDPRNLLLARQERLRVEAEIIRDAALSASGLLNRQIGGPSVRPPQPDGVYAFTQVNKRWMTATDENRYRRGLYTFFVRSAPYPLFTTFDAPDFQTVCTRRIRSNTPLQSLTMANDAAFLEIARGLAARLVREVPGEFAATLDRRIRLAFELCYSRQPSGAELTALRGYIERQAQTAPAAPMVDAATADKGLTPAQSAALTAAARVLFNTDNFITRE